MKLSEIQSPPQKLKLSQVSSGADPDLDVRKFGTPEFEAAKERAMQREAQNAAGEMGVLGRGVAAFDRGITRLGQGITQLAQHADPLGIESGAFGGEAAAQAKRIRQEQNAKIREEQRLWDRGGISDTTEGLVGDIVGQAAATAPMMAVGGGGLLASTAKAAGTGAVAGALNPVNNTRSDIESLVTGEAPRSFADEKLGQLATGAAWGGGANVTLRGLGSLAERLWPANWRPQALRALAGKAADPKVAQEGADLSARTNVDLTVGEQLDSKRLKQLENTVRQSVWTRDQMHQGDKARIQQLADSFDRTLDSLTKADSSPIAVAGQLRDAVTSTKTALESARRKAAEVDYKAVDDLAGKAGIVDPTKMRSALDTLIEENSIAPKGSGQRALADSLTSLKEQMASGRLRATDLLKTRRYLSQAAGGATTLSGQLDRPIQKRAATMLMSALDSDLDDASKAIGGDIGKALQDANTRYRGFSQEIEAVNSSPLGKLLGEEFASDATGAFNSIAPEVVVERMSKLKPSQVAMVKTYLENESPETLQAWRRSVLEDALTEAKKFPATAGGDTPALRPAVLNNELESLDKNKVLGALFGKADRAQIDDLIKVSRKMADSTGRNTSETNVASETWDIFNRPLDALKQGRPFAATSGAVFQLALKALGTKKLAQALTDPKGRGALFALKRLPPESAKARQAAAYLAALYNSDQGE